MSNGIPLDKAALASTVLEAILYGFSVFMYGVTVWILFYRRSTVKVNWRMLVVASILFVLSSIHVGLNVKRTIEGTINHRNDSLDGPSEWFGKLKTSTFISKNVIYALQTVTGDSVVIYRCYVIWQSVYIIIVPIIMLSATIATAVGSVWSADNLPDGATIFSSHTLPWITSFWAISLSTNVICTSLLFYKIWTTTADDRRKQIIMPVLLIMVDAALLYTVSLTISLILFAIESNGQTFMVDMLVPIISITFFMVIMRSGIARASISTKEQVQSVMVFSSEPSEPFPPRAYKRSRSGDIDTDFSTASGSQW